MTHVTVLGAHGKVGRLLVQRLRRLDTSVAGIIRKSAQQTDVASDGADPIVLDIEEASATELAALVPQTDAFVFAAGAGPSSGPARKATVDRDGLVKTAEAASLLNVRRVVQISFLGADQQIAQGRSASWTAYHEAKRSADNYLRATALDWLIIRPGVLHDGPSDGVRIVADDWKGGRTSRDLVAALIAIALTGSDLYPSRRVLDIVDGPGELISVLAD